MKNIIDTISYQIGRYLSALALISAVTGMFVWIALVHQVDFAATWGILAFLLNFIPDWFHSRFHPLSSALVQFYQLYACGGNLSGPAHHQVTIGNFITPKVMGDRLNLSQ